MASESEVLFSGGDEGRQKERGSSVPMAAESERQQREATASWQRARGIIPTSLICRVDFRPGLQTS